MSQATEPLTQATYISRSKKRIFPHNAVGLAEGIIIPPEDGGRRSRRHHVEQNGKLSNINKGVVYLLVLHCYILCYVYICCSDFVVYCLSMFIYYFHQLLSIL